MTCSGFGLYLTVSHNWETEKQNKSGEREKVANKNNMDGNRLWIQEWYRITHLATLFNVSIYRAKESRVTKPSFLILILLTFNGQAILTSVCSHYSWTLEPITSQWMHFVIVDLSSNSSWWKTSRLQAQHNLYILGMRFLGINRYRTILAERIKCIHQYIHRIRRTHIGVEFGPWFPVLTTITTIQCLRISITSISENIGRARLQL